MTTILQSRPKLGQLKPSLWFLTLSVAFQPVQCLPPFPMHLEKRTPVLKDAGLLTIDNKVPLDLILLIAATMVFAIICLSITLINLRRPWVGGSHEITQERHRAKTDLRLRGGKKAVVERRQIQRPRNEFTLSQHSIDSRSGLLPPSHSPEMYQKPVTNHVGPRIAQDQQSRASRGYSFYSKGELASMTMPGYDTRGINLSKPQTFVGGPREFYSPPGMVKSLAVPAIPYNDYGSDTSSTAFSSPDPSSSNSGKSSEASSSVVPVGPRPLPGHARRNPTRRQSQNGDMSIRRVSSTSAGALRRLERDQQRPEMPSAINRAYAYERTSPSRGIGVQYGTQRGLIESQYNTVHSSGYFEGSVSEGHNSGSHDGSGHNTPLKQHPLQTTAQIPRTKPLGLYENEIDFHQSNHLTGLLDNRQAPKTANTSWRNYL